MNDWRTMLRASETPAQMDPAAAARIRAEVIRAARVAVPEPAGWGMRIALAAFAMVVMVMSLLTLQRSPALDLPAAGSPLAGSERRQIQFATPGGTRIIWEINPDFRLGETIP